MTNIRELGPDEINKNTDNLCYQLTAISGVQVTIIKEDKNLGFDNNNKDNNDDNKFINLIINDNAHNDCYIRIHNSDQPAANEDEKNIFCRKTDGDRDNRQATCENVEYLQVIDDDRDEHQVSSEDTDENKVVDDATDEHKVV